MHGVSNCLTSGWCDYSEEHRRVREEIEKAIDAYFSQARGEYWLQVIVAPYGSGKTTLLRHLARYAESRGVKPLLVELKEVVDYIAGKYGVIHESMLPSVLEEFFEEKTGSREGLLLIDEVEETYNALRGIIKHETSPFRSLAEAIRNSSTRLFVVIAFGPSSVFKEAVFGPVAWRSRVYQIPLLSRDIIAEWLENIIDMDELRDLLANTIWWASKGRTGWAKLLVEVFAKEAYNALRENSGSKLEDLLMGSEVLSREITEGVPLMDKAGYIGFQQLLGPARDAAPLLALLVGPIPYSIVSKYAGPDILGTSPGYITTRSIIGVDELLTEAVKAAARIAKLNSIPSISLEHAVYVLKLVARAWSSKGFIAYDPSSLHELVELAIDFSRDLFPGDTGAQKLLSMISIDLLDLEPRRTSEPVVAIRPSLIPRIYPLASSNPLIGCARRVAVPEVARLIEALKPEELREASKTILPLLGINPSEAIIVPYSLVADTTLEALCTLIGEPSYHILLAAPHDDALKPRILDALSALGVVSYTPVYGKPGLLLYSLIYTSLVCGVEKLLPSEKRIIDTYAEYLKSVMSSTTSRKALGAESSGKLAVLEEKYGKVIHALEGVAACTRLSSRVASLAAELVEGAGYEAKIVDKVFEATGEILEAFRKAGLELGGNCIAWLLSKKNPLLSRIYKAASRHEVEAKYSSRLPSIASRLKRLSNTGWETYDHELEKLVSQVEAYAAKLAELVGEAGCSYAVELARILEDEFAEKISERIVFLEKIGEKLVTLKRIAESLPEEARIIALQAIGEELEKGLRNNSLEPLRRVELLLTRILSSSRRAEDSRKKIEELVGELDTILSSMLDELSLPLSPRLGASPISVEAANGGG